jgi:tetratricopeptide (TPR) repeat protein
MKNMFFFFWLVALSGFSGFGQTDGSPHNWLQKADSLAVLRDFENALLMLGKAEEYTLNRFGEASDEYGYDHLSLEMSLAHLSNLYWKAGKMEQATQYFSETAARQRAHLSNAARHFSEREVNSYLSMFGKEVDQHFSFAFDQCRAVPSMAGACFDNALFHRGFLLNTSYLIRNRGTASPKVAEQLDQLKSCQRLLSAEYAKAAPERDSASVAQLEAQANALEKDLARTVSGFGEAIRQVPWQEVQSALKPREAALEFVHLNYFKPEPTDRGSCWWSDGKAPILHTRNASLLSDTNMKIR